ncbi:MAG: DUF1579 domain-containing protein [Bacteroidetes bacterium]|nr:DUF1579 domain-containing protein [Bacteroidota bacterium]
MKGGLLLVLILAFSFCLYTQEGGQDMSPEEEAWMSYMQPGAEHAMLAKMVGEWKVETKMWMDPMGEPEFSEGKSVNEMILGGRYLLQTHSGAITMGMPMEGVGIDAYDNVKKKYISLWMDNFGTGVAYAEGEWDEEAGGIVCWGTMTDPMTGSDLEYKMVITHHDEDHSQMDMYMVMGDEEIKSMEMHYKRVK